MLVAERMVSFKFYLNSIAILLYWVAAVFDPIGSLFGLRYAALFGISFCLIFLGNYVISDLRNLNIRFIFITYVAIFMPLYGMFIYLIRGGTGGDFIDTSYIASSLLLFLSLIYNGSDLIKTGLRSMVFSLRCLVIAIIVIYATMLLDLDKEWFSFFTLNNIAILTIREYSGINLPYIYFVASPMLIFLIAYELHVFFDNYSLISLLLCVTSLFAFAISGTRSHMILSMLYIFIYYILLGKKHYLLLVLIAAVVFSAYLSFGELDIINSFFSKSETNNSIKLTILSGYGDVFSDPFTAFFGQGYNAHAWSLPLRSMISMDIGASKTELTYLEVLRVYGAVFSFPFYILLLVFLFNLKILNKKYSWLYPAFVIYFINSSLNPYLFSTNGMLPIGLALAILSIEFNSKQTLHNTAVCVPEVRSA